MSYIKNMLFNLEDMMVRQDETAEELMIQAAMREMEEVIRDHTLPDYVVLQSGKRCYLNDPCDPINEVCCC